MSNAVEIGWRDQTSSEVRPWAFDLSAELDNGDVPQGTPASVLTDLLTGQPFSAGLTSGATITGTVVTQTISNLAPGHFYRLVITTSMGGAKETASALYLRCSF